MAVMQIAPEQGAFLQLLVKLVGAQNALELGTFTGYSSTAMALAMPSSGVVTTVDASDEYLDVAKEC